MRAETSRRWLMAETPARHALLDGGEHDEFDEDVMDLLDGELLDAQDDLAHALDADLLDQAAYGHGAEGPSTAPALRGTLASGPAHGGNRERALTATPNLDRRSRL